MILQSLVQEYEALHEKGKVPDIYYSVLDVSYSVELKADGTFMNMASLTQEIQVGKKIVKRPQPMVLPESVQRSGAGTDSPNFLADNVKYALGVDKANPKRALDCFASFCELHHLLLDKAQSPRAKALLSFLDNWNPCTVDEDPRLKNALKELQKSGNLVFYVFGSGFVHEDEEIKALWEVYRSEKQSSVKMRCLVSGNYAPIAITHPVIKNVVGAQKMGVRVVSYNARAYESYGGDEKQGLNAPVSEYAAFAYTTALNYLLSDRKHTQSFGDTTLVYWAEDGDVMAQDLFAEAIGAAFEAKTDVEEGESAETVENELNSTFVKLVSGKSLGEEVLGFKTSTKFYVLGVSPNKARLAVRFFYRDTYKNIVENVVRHYCDMHIEKRFPYDIDNVPLRMLLSETVFKPKKKSDSSLSEGKTESKKAEVPKSSAKSKPASPLLAGETLRSMIVGLPYPEMLYNNILLRIRAEGDINKAKVGFIKAYLLRNKGDKYKEVIQMGLNENNTDIAYILGRLFAVLEKAQSDANPNVQNTIKDNFLTSASTTPAVVFPHLLKLAQYHIKKAKYGKDSDRRIEMLMNMLPCSKEAYPKFMNSEKQGLFILGYYQQRNALYKSKKNKDDEGENNNV